VIKQSTTISPQRTPITAPPARTPVSRLLLWPVSVGAVLASLLWSYWPTVSLLFKDWQRDQNYSVGQLVPLAALFLLWRDRAVLRNCRVRPCWWGIGVILLAEMAVFFGLQDFYESVERYAFVLAVVGLVLLIGGWQVFRQVFWILLLLVLMVPLPGRIHNTISGPLQTQATVGAVFVLELLGVTVARQGNVVLLNDSIKLAVAEACSGLRMLTAFVVVAAVLAYLVRRPRWQKAILLASSIPVAIACNLIRLVVTAELYLVADSKWAEGFFHGFAGIVMMPMALFFLLAELWLLNQLVTKQPVQATSTEGPPGDNVRHKRRHGGGKSSYQDGN